MQTTTLTSALPPIIQEQGLLFTNHMKTSVRAGPSPKSFILPDLLSSIASVSKYKTSAHQQAGEKAGREWIHRFKAVPVAKIDRFLAKGNFGRLTSMSYPQADEEHYITAYKYLLWAFLVDDAWDEGGISDDFTADHVQAEAQECWHVLDLDDPAEGDPKHPFAAMLQSILIDMKKTATPGCRQRFADSFKAWSVEVINQCRRRSRSSLPTVEEYIDIRRKAVGQEPVAAVIEYAVQAKLPDEVFEHPTIIAMSEASTDILTWPNDLCSFNKEQAEGDYQNFVCVLMRERHLDLQGAVNELTGMIKQRVDDYRHLKASLPSFGDDVDRELARYLTEIEHEVYGAVRWCYESARYWKEEPKLHCDLVVELFPLVQSS